MIPSSPRVLPRRFDQRIEYRLPVDKLVARLVGMKTIGAFEAKTHLAELLQKAFEGETIRITRRGVLVAKLVPADEPEERDLRRVVGEIREIREGATLNGVSIRELINEGRRY